MAESISLSKWSSPRWLKFLIIVLLALGVILRFTNLDLKPYWFDEASTSIQLTGYTDGEVLKQVEGKILSVADLQKYQYPAAEKNALDTAKGLAIKEPQLSPLYFILTRFWVQLFGNSVAITRSVSAIFSLLALPCVYWLCLELFKSPAVGWVAIALFAVSPFHILYAQEARPPSLWTLTILLTHIAFLRALRLKTPLSWFLYAIAIATGLYTYLFAAFISIAHGVYLIIIERLRLTRTVLAFVATSMLGILAFMPWVIYALIGNRQSIGGYQGDNSRSFYALIRGWIGNLGRFFVDFSIGETSPRIYVIPYMLLLLALVGLAIYAIYHLCHTTSRPIWLFIVTTIALPALPLVLQDIVSGGVRSAVIRYLIPTYLSIQLAVAYLFASKLLASKSDGLSTTTRQQLLWKSCLAIVLCLGLVSSVAMVKSELWWNKASSNPERELAKIINQANRPLVISDAYLVLMLSFSHSLDANVHTLLLPKSTVPTNFDGFNDIFLYMPSQNLLEGLKGKHPLEPVKLPNEPPSPTALWKLQK